MGHARKMKNGTEWSMDRARKMKNGTEWSTGQGRGVKRPDVLPNLLALEHLMRSSAAIENLFVEKERDSSVEALQSE